MDLAVGTESLAIEPMVMPEVHLPNAEETATDASSKAMSTGMKVEQSEQTLSGQQMKVEQSEQTLSGQQHSDSAAMHLSSSPEASQKKSECIQMAC